MAKNKSSDTDSTETQPKNIVLCSDGTGNSGFKKRGTNVYKLFEAVDLHHEVKQLAFYDDGVGTENLKILRLLGGALGFGLRQNVIDLYSSLARVYNPGDRIYLFGFSRGAWTVRMLAGFILKCGIVQSTVNGRHVDVEKPARVAYKAYREKYAAWLQRLLFLKNPNKQGEALERFHKDAPTHPGKIHFIGVWDTVDAYGVPFDWLSTLFNKVFIRYSFEDFNLSSPVKYARHAVSIDDERKTFHPVMWNEELPKDKARILQVWFPGVHANVGGGYPKQGVSLVALDWMMREAENAGDEEKEKLKFVEADRQFVEDHANADDKVHDSRSGLAAFYRYAPRIIERICNVSYEKAHDSESKLAAFFRFAPRQIKKFFGGPKVKIELPWIHVSAFRRIYNSTMEYSPGHLPRDFRVAFTPSASDPTRTARAEEDAEKVRKRLSGKVPDADRNRWLIRARRGLQWALYLLVAFFLGMMVHGVKLQTVDDAQLLFEAGIKLGESEAALAECCNTEIVLSAESKGPDKEERTAEEAETGAGQAVAPSCLSVALTWSRLHLSAAWRLAGEVKSPSALWADVMSVYRLFTIPFILLIIGLVAIFAAAWALRCKTQAAYRKSWRELRADLLDPLPE